MNSNMDLSKIDTKSLSEKIIRAANESITEEDLKIKTEYILRTTILDKYDIPWARYEKGIFISGVRGRSDVLYGHVVIEYESPNAFQSTKNFEKSIDQAKKYIIGHAKIPEALSGYFGIVLDGTQIGFVRFKERDKTWTKQGPYPVGSDTILKLLEAIRGLTRKPLDVEYLIKDFGPESEMGKKTISALYRKIENASTERTRTLFDDWKRVFSQVCSYSREKIKGLEKTYGLKRRIDPEKLLFCVHSYYGLVMKLLAAEVAVLFGDPYLQSYIRKLEDAYLHSHKTLKSELDDLEEGSIFTQIGILNFLEADYFSWYLDEWDEEIANSIVEVVKVLASYEVGTAELEPERIKDIFKRLYQYLVPKDIRHDLGEYYTPDWLADLVLNEVGYDGDPKKRLLDPSCGSGTFLVLALRRVKDYQEEHFLDKGEVLEDITANVVGFDLNPLAVMASRANYLIALGGYIRYRKKPFQIPVYLADSILVERRSTLLEESYVLRTVVGEFSVPTKVVDAGLLPETLTVVQHCIKNKYSKKEFKELVREKINVIDEKAEYILSGLFETLIKLEKEGRNKIWIRILKNSFAPLFEEKFNYVVGNPPWVNWENLPAEYRKVTRKLWEQYGLIQKIRGGASGRIKRDIAMLFVTVSQERYMKNDATLGLILPFTFFKSQVGAEFRKYLASKTDVRKVHDLVELRPFEGAINRTSLLIFTKGGTKFPVSCQSWARLKGKNIGFGSTLPEARNLTKTFRMVLQPIRGNHAAESPWLILRKGAIPAVRKVIGSSTYKAHEGVNTRGATGIFWVDILDKHGNRLAIQNRGASGKGKKKEITMEVESDLIFPLIRGRDVAKWRANPSGYTIMTHNDKDGKVFNERDLKIKWPHTFSFLNEFRKDLESRKLFGESIKDEFPFYTLFQIGSYTFAPYKVAWKYVSGKISGKGEFLVSVIAPGEMKWVGRKNAILDHRLIFIPFEKEEEAFFVASLLNFPVIRLVVAGYTVETAISTHVPKYVTLPRFDAKNQEHKRIAELSKNAHELADKGDKKALDKVEKNINGLISRIYGLSGSDLSESLKSLSILEGKALK